MSRHRPRIGIWADLANESKPRGIGLHVVNLVNALTKVDTEHEWVLYYLAPVLGAGTALSRITRRDNVMLRPIRYPDRLQKRYPRLWWDYLVPHLIRRDGIEVFHGPNHFLPAASCKKVVTIHDLAFMKMPLYPAGITKAYCGWTMKAMRAADRIIAISKCTMNDVVDAQIPADKVTVIYPGGSNEGMHACAGLDNEAAVRRKCNIGGRFILFVGALHPRKNIPLLIRAFERCKRRGLGQKLVIAGQPGPASEEIATVIGQLGLQADVILTGYIEDEELHTLYRLADAFVLPSRYEGFGMILHEAMSLGVPVIAVKSSAIGEVVGDSGVLVELDNVEQLAAAILGVLADPALRHELSKRGRIQACEFCWERCARETIGVYRALCKDDTGNGAVS